MRYFKKNKKRSKEPTVAPGMTDAAFGEKASEDDVSKGDFTQVTRVFLDENDPS